MKVLLTHPGTHYSYQLAAQLQRLGLLQQFVTGFAISEKTWEFLNHVLPKSISKKLKTRTVFGVPENKIFRLPLLELKAISQLRKKKNAEEILHQRNIKFQKRIPDRMLKSADVIIGFDNASWILMERCRALNIPFILDASIAHPVSKQFIFQQLKSRFPIWQHELKAKPNQLLDIEQREMQMATHIVAASSFTKATYVSHVIDAHKISINPYGTDLNFFQSKWQEQPTADGGRRTVEDDNHRLTFFFFGGITARKGFPFLCAIWKKFHAIFPNTKLVAGGYGEPPNRFELPAGIQLIGAIHPDDRRHWFQQADVFVFPSFFEGFAQVILEAMASGLPVITTTATAGNDVITNGKDGFVMDPGDDDALMNALTFFATQPENIEKMGRKAREKVADFTWENYGHRWKQILEQVCQNTQP